MKYLQKFENLKLLTDWDMLLSDEDFKKYAEEFDLLIEPFLEYADIGYYLDFETAYGTKVIMKYQDYLDKNDKYKEFIHGFPAMRYGKHIFPKIFFISNIIIPYDYEKLLDVLVDVNVSVGRVSDIGWKLKDFVVKSSTSFGKPIIKISHEFIKEFNDKK